jgi:uncharacterized repeat protein (TIGR03803 family)
MLFETFFDLRCVAVLHSSTIMGGEKDAARNISIGAGGLGGVAVTSGPASAGSYQVVYSFGSGSGSGSDGNYPYAGLINVGGTLYGTTVYGGASGQGTVFAVSPATGAETVVYTFKGGNDGANPYANLIEVRGKLYGTSANGGASYYGFGTVYEVNPTTGNETVLHSFQGGSDGANPFANLIDVGGTLYGTTEAGGPSNVGTVYVVNPATGAEKVVIAFIGGSSAANPDAGLIKVGGTLYGTSSAGGASHEGTVFKVNAKTSVEKVVYSFQGGSDGELPYAGLTRLGGTLYGTALGSANGNGTVFAVNPATGAERSVYEFESGTDGANPYAGLIKVGVKLYGTTYRGAYGLGTLFEVDPTTGKEKVLHSFGIGNDGAGPDGNLVEIGGTLYGTTFLGGTSSRGTVFAYTP